MKQYIIETRSRYTDWTIETGGERFATRDEAERAVHAIPRSERVNDDGDVIEHRVVEDYVDSIEINIYRSAGTWYAARTIAGEYDGCDELDVAANASEADARREALTMPLRASGPRIVRRAEDVG